MSESRAARGDGPHHVVVGVTAGIAAYKSCTLVRLLKKAGLDVTVVPTPASLDMVGRTTWEALSGRDVHTLVTENAAGVEHVGLARSADLVVVAPATANTIAKVRAGVADNLLTATLLTATCPILLVPAMHSEMWLNPATQDNVATLRHRGIEVVEPAVGQLTGPDSGPGRMPEPEEIAQLVQARLAGAPRDLTGLKIAISAGGTHEAIDPVRFIGNRSTGIFGAEIAAAATQRGADVTLVAANVTSEVLARVPGARIVPVVSAAQLGESMHAAARDADILIMAAAVADYRPEHAAEAKIKKTEAGLTLTLVENSDILAELAHHRHRERQTIVGFAAETGDGEHDVLQYGRDKARRKGADLMVINEVGTDRGFGPVNTAVTIVDRDGNILGTASGTKSAMARHLLDAIVTWRERP